MSRIPGTLILENGTEFSGLLFGAPISSFAYGEVVFNTSMTGYQELLSDPSYCGQIICMTVPHLGNTGINAEDLESSKAWCSGFIIHELSESPSNWRSETTLESYLLQQQVPALTRVDTRALTRHLRSCGVVRGIILPDSKKHLASHLFTDLPRFEERDLISEVSTTKPFFWKKPDSKSRFRVIAMDFGIKWNMLRHLEKLGCEVEVVPAKTTAPEILQRRPHGVFLSNGPGNPTTAPYAIKTVQELLGKVPLFGVCMGHQILGLAIGAKTYKLKFGHRGGNQPVLEKTTGRVEISSHNHGYSIDGTTLPNFAQVTHMNLNDKTVEGLEIKEANAFSVQYHPEACPGPHDSVELFEKFIQNMSQYVSKIS